MNIEITIHFAQGILIILKTFLSTCHINPWLVFVSELTALFRAVFGSQQNSGEGTEISDMSLSPTRT